MGSLNQTDDFFSFQDEGNNLYLRPAFGTFQGVDFINLINELRPGPAAGFLVRGIVNDVKQWLILQTHFFPLAPGGIGIMSVIANERFIMTGDMETNPMEKLDGVYDLELLFFFAALRLVAWPEKQAQNVCRILVGIPLVFPPQLSVWPVGKHG